MNKLEQLCIANRPAWVEDEDTANELRDNGAIYCRAFAEAFIRRCQEKIKRTEGLEQYSLSVAEQEMGEFLREMEAEQK